MEWSMRQAALQKKGRIEKLYSSLTSLTMQQDHAMGIIESTVAFH